MDGLIGGPEKKRMSSRKKQVLAYSIVLVVCYAAFWLFAGGMGAMGYSFLVQLFTLPLANFIIALLMGLDKSWKERQWWLLLYFGFGFFSCSTAPSPWRICSPKGALTCRSGAVLHRHGPGSAWYGPGLRHPLGRELAACPEGLRRAWLVYGLVWGVCVLVPYLVAFLSWACTFVALFVPIPESAFLSVQSIIPVLFLAGPCGWPSWPPPGWASSWANPQTGPAR